MSRRIAGMAILLPLVTVLAGADAAALSLSAARRVVVQGRVVSSTGEPMGGWPVQLIGTQRYLELSRHTSGGATGTVARVLTDANGYFSIDVERERRYQFWFLRFVDPAHLDTVRYVPPEDQEITAMVRRGRVASVQATIATRKDWPELERRVGEAGGESTEKGRILRTLGLPEKTVVSGSGSAAREEWWYFTRGIVYMFQDSGPATARRFEPVKPPAGSEG